jgi:hypothetical protein
MEYMSDKLVALIEKNAKQLATNWLSDVQKHPSTPTYHTYDETELYNRAFDVYSRLSKWISKTPHLGKGNDRRIFGYGSGYV